MDAGAVSFPAVDNTVSAQHLGLHRYDSYALFHGGWRLVHRYPVSTFYG